MAFHRLQQLIALSLILILKSCVFAQSAETSGQPEINDRVLNCELNLFHQDYVVNAAMLRVKQNEVLIVVLRLGEFEADLHLERRLTNVRIYFDERGKQIPRNNLIITRGDRVQGNGRIEYYLQGKLFQQLLYPKNGYICHSCCGPDHDYYPERKSENRKTIIPHNN